MDNLLLLDASVVVSRVDAVVGIALLLLLLLLDAASVDVSRVGIALLLLTVAVSVAEVVENPLDDTSVSSVDDASVSVDVGAADDEDDALLLLVAASVDVDSVVVSSVDAVVGIALLLLDAAFVVDACVVVCPSAVCKVSGVVVIPGLSLIAVFGCVGIVSVVKWKVKGSVVDVASVASVDVDETYADVCT